jgi:RNA polymerase sigma-70 factor (ECF subfamily)
VREHQELAFRVAFLVTRDEDEAADAAQEGFIKAYYALDRFRPGAPFRPWLLRIVANEAKNRRKSASRRAGLALRAADAMLGQSGPSPETAALAEEDRRALFEAIETLRDDERLVVSYRYLLGLSEAETAETLDIPRGTVKSRLSRALAHLRQALTAESSCG